MLARLDLVLAHRGCLLDYNAVALRGVDSLSRDLDRSVGRAVRKRIWVIDGTHNSSNGMVETFMGPEDLVDLVEG